MQGARLLLLLAPLALILLAGCYETPLPECAFSCSQSGDCPSGYSCRADDWCKRDDVDDEFLCAPAQPDATSPDAAATDAAPPDGAVDAMPASPSASIFGT